MSILVVSHDEEAAQLLCAALARSGSDARWELVLESARAAAQEKTPLVVVADTAVEGHETLIDEVRRRNPSARGYLMVDPSAHPTASIIPSVAKPFDAAEFAELLAREQRVAELECGQRSLQRELEHAERLAAIGRIAASMAHEINNPLAVIQASASYMADVAKDTLNHELAECAEDTLLAAERIGSFVQHVCGYARRDRPELSDRPLRQAVEMALRLVRPRARDRKVEVVFRPGADPRVPHDPPRLAQAVLNLLSNAVDAAADGGRHVSVEVVSRSAEEVAIVVDDDGPGIAAEIVDHVFEPFATTKPAGQGTGLGLAISVQIVSDHGGRISLARLDHGGTRAEIGLRPIDTSRYRVLVLDEQPALARTLGAALRREGFDVASSGTLASALQILSEKRAAVIVTDLSLPDAVGSELLWALRQASAGTRLLVVTSAVRRLPGADRILEKPCDREELIGAVRQLCVQFEGSS